MAIAEAALMPQDTVHVMREANRVQVAGRVASATTRRALQAQLAPLPLVQVTLQAGPRTAAASMVSGSAADDVAQRCRS